MPVKGNVIKATDLVFRDGSNSFTGNQVFDAKIMIRDGASVDQGTPSVTMALGDRDTGFEWNSDGNFSLYANAQEVVNYTNSSVTIKKPLNMNNNPINGISQLVGQYGTIAKSTDEWLRLNDDGSHSNGVYFGSSLVRTDGELNIGSSGSVLKVNASTFTYNGNTVWHAGNDGAGSGLDADMIDGVQLSGLVQTSRTVSAGSGLTGGGALSSNITLSVNFGGTGSATTVARSDHNHDGTYARLSSTNTFTDYVTIDRGSGALKLKPGSLDHVYMEFYADSDNPSTRSGYVGFPASGTSNLEIKNEMTNGNITFTTNGTGNVLINGNKVWHAGNDGSGSGLDADLIRGQQPYIYQGQASGTLNSATSPGVYWITNFSSITNGRSGVYDWGHMVTFSGHGPVQLYFADTDTSSGGLFYRQDYDSSGGWTSWTKVWTENNDGSGSGLDADMVDGVHLSGLVQTSRTISAGSGLTGGGDLSANRTLSVNFAGTGVATTVARSDHNHDGTYLKLNGGGTVTGGETVFRNIYVTLSNSDLKFTDTDGSTPIIINKNGILYSGLFFVSNTLPNPTVWVNFTQSVLWSGAKYPTGSDTITPSKTLSSCSQGWILVWSDYDPGVGPNDYNWVYTFVPKFHGTNYSGGGVYFEMPTTRTQYTRKMLYIYNDKIVGNDDNDDSDIWANDVCLRYVLEW